MEPLVAYTHTILKGLKGEFGLIGLYGAVQRVFITFGLTAGPACFLIDAPFGKWSGSSNRFTVNGNLGWLLMEIVSPLTLLFAMTTPPTTSLGASSSTLTPFSWSSILYFVNLPSRVILALKSLPRARAILAGVFVIHYINRSIISSVRNPGRARMNISVPLSAALFNLANGGMMGLWIAGGHPITSNNIDGNWGLRRGSFAQIGFAIGLMLWLSGFIGNILSDEILYELKKEKMRQRQQRLNESDDVQLQKEKEKRKSPSERYSIPRGFLYDRPFGGVSHPSYSTEWVEWIGFTLAAFCLAPSPFPALALSPINSPTFRASISSLFRNGSSAPYNLIRSVPPALRPFPQWFLQPPAIFVVQEILVMFPRAYSGHRWYQRTFGREWPRSRKIVIPGLL